MARLVNILRRAGTYHFRRVVPSHLRVRLGRRELVRSLGTAAPATAKLKADLLYWASERLFAAAGSAMLSPDQLSRLVQDFYHLVLEVDDHHRLLDGRVSEEVRLSRAAYLNDLTAEARRALAQNEFDNVNLAAAVVLQRSGIDRDTLGPGEYNQVCQAILRAGVDLSRALRARHEGDFSYEPQDALLKTPPTRPGSLPSATEVLRREAPVPAALMSSPEPLLSNIGPEFRREQLATGAWDRQTAAQAGATFRLFIDICSDRPLAGYARADADLFRKQVQRLPADYAKAARYRALSVAEILSAYEAEPRSKRTAVITQRTVKRHFSALSALWSSAVAGGQVSENIFTGFRFVATKKASDQRAMWNREELAQLFASPIWSGCKSLARRTEPGSLIIKDERFWLPLISVFSGMRQEEICQLHIEDIREAEGVWHFDVNDRPPRMLKNDNAARLVPIHSELIRLGLLEHVEEYRQAGHVRLFPSLQPGGADGRLGHAFSKWFTRYRRDVKLYRPGLDFHSFRHTATTLMHHAGIERSVIDHVTGHATPGETSRYTKGSRLSQLKNAIEQIELGFELLALKPPGGPKVKIISPTFRKIKAVHRRRKKPSIPRT